MSPWCAHLNEFGTRPALIVGEQTHTYAQLVAAIAQDKQALAKIIQPGQVVAVLSDYHFAAISVFFALSELKAVIVPIVAGTPDAVAQKCQVAQVDWVVQFSEQAPHQWRIDPSGPSGTDHKHDLIEQLQATQQPGLVLFSSGSTGVPKAMVHNLARLMQPLRHKKTKRLNMLVFLMFDHIGGLNTLLNSLAMGAKVVLVQSRAPLAVAALIEQHHIHVLPASPTFLNLLLMAKAPQKYDLSSLKLVTYGTEPMPASLLARLRAAFPKTKMLQTFGTSETGIAQTQSRDSGSLAFKLTDPHVQSKVVDGELWLKTDTQILGYLNAPMTAFNDEGWFKTGDWVEELADGYVQVKGRLKEIINVGGEKVLPSEVESVLFEMPEIEDASVYPETNAITGQMVAAEVVLTPGVRPEIVKTQIRQYCVQRLARYKVPAKLVFVSQTHFSDRFKKQRLA